MCACACACVDAHTQLCLQMCSEGKQAVRRSSPLIHAQISTYTGIEAYLQVVIYLKQQPLSSELMADYTGLALDNPKAVHMWSLWASAESSSGNVKVSLRCNIRNAP